MEQTLSQQIAENLSYYIGKNNRCTKDGKCKYSGKTLGLKTQGCFVGRLLKPKERVKADLLSVSVVHHLVRKREEYNITVPEIIVNNVALMQQFQQLHDKGEYWDKYVLSDDGKDFLTRLIQMYSLDKNDFEFALK